MHLITMKCPACAANVSVDNDESKFRCEYCQNQISIIKPTNIKTNVDSLNEAEQKTYSNYISILEQSMKAGNYSEAYNYCNKALEINPKSGALWENKAICSFWLSSLSILSNDKANEITTYLNASKQNEPNSSTYNTVAETIADNLFSIISYKYSNLRPEFVRNSSIIYTKEYLMQLLNYLNMFELCFQIFPKTVYLKKIIELLINGKIKWIMSNGYNSFISNNLGFNAKQKKEILISKIQSIEKNYEPPLLPKTDYSIIWIILGIAFFLAIMFLAFKK